MKFRAATTQDLPELLAVQEAGAVVGLSNIFPQDRYPFPREALLARWSEELADGETKVFVSTDDLGGITGFAALRGDQLLHFGTALETWGTGLATRLHDFVLAAFPATVEPVRLRVYVENRRARRFYEKVGWTKTGARSLSAFPPHAELVEYVRSRVLVDSTTTAAVSEPERAVLRLVEAHLRSLEHRPLLVAIDGHSASGKTTLAAGLEAQVDAVVLHMDEFYRDEPEEVRVRYSPAEGVARYFDWERMLRLAVLPLLSGNVCRYQPFDWAAGSGLGPEVTVEPAPVVIIEGVYSARPEFRPHLDATVLVTAAASVRSARQRLRHEPHAWEARWEVAEKLYFRDVCPPSSFDLVVATGA